jgi:hypothetical protein
MRRRAGDRFGRICPAGAVVPSDGLSAEARLGLDAAIAPPQLEQSDNVLRLRHLQVVGHRPS